MDLPSNVRTAPKTQCSQLFTLDLTIWYGGTFNHGHGATYVGGGTFIFKEVTSFHFTLLGISNLCHGVGLIAKGFYHLRDSKFEKIESQYHFDKLFIMGCRDGHKLDIYADCGVFLNSTMPEAQLPSYSQPQSQLFNETQGPELEMHVNDIEMETFNGEGDHNSDIEGLDDTMYDSGFEEDSDSEANGEGTTNNEGDNNDVRNDTEEVMHNSGDGEDELEDDAESDLENDIEEPNIWDSDENLDSAESSDDDDQPKEKFSMFNEVDLFNPKLKLGMRFRSKDLLKDAVTSFAIINQRNLKFRKNDADRLHVKCEGRKNNRCKWFLHGLKVKDEETFQIFKYYDKHSCRTTRKVRLLTSTWLGKRYQQDFVLEPDKNLVVWRADVKKTLGYNISKQQSYRARNYALSLLHGDPVEQYTLLWDFAEEVKRANPGSNVLVILDPNGSGKFDKMYMCLEPLKRGFKLGCRPIIGVDGCHLKGPHVGVLLTAVGVDPNNNIYPIAWAVVQKECIETWSWFLRLLENDLGMENHRDWTFISDKQKGLLNVFDNYFSKADKRFCLRHLLKNMNQAGFRGDAYKDAIWAAGRASTIPQFERKMAEIEKLSPKALEWLSNRHAKHWSRSHFNTFPKCDMLLNNMCESYNRAILDARKMPILSMMIWLMMHAMKRLQRNRDKCNKNWKGRVCPKIRKIMNNKSVDGSCLTTKSTSWIWLIQTSTDEGYCVDLQKKSCACRLWDLSGIPCKHALEAISENDWDESDFVHDYYGVETYKNVYSVAIVPINGRAEWAKTGLVQPLPPNEGRNVGRPESIRRREPDEPAQKQKKKPRGRPAGPSKTCPYSMKRQQVTCRCSFCGELGHNKKGCSVYKNSLAGKLSDQTHSRKMFQAKRKGVASSSRVPSSTVGKRKTSKKCDERQKQRGVEERNCSEPTLPTPRTTYLQEPNLPAPTMSQQLMSSGNTPTNTTHTLKVDNAVVHMTQANTTGGVISRSQLEDLRVAKRESIKQGKKRLENFEL